MLTMILSSKTCFEARLVDKSRGEGQVEVNLVIVAAFMLPSPFAGGSISGLFRKCAKASSFTGPFLLLLEHESHECTSLTKTVQHTCGKMFFRDRTLCVQDVLRTTFPAPQQIDRCQNFDTINKSSDVSVGNCDHLPQGNLQKSSFNLQGRIKSPVIAFIAFAW